MRILLVTTRFPFPAWRGQQVRTMEWLRALEDHQLVCVCPRPDDDGFFEDSGLERDRFLVYGDSIIGRTGAAISGAALGPMPVQEGMYATSAARKAVRAAIRAVRPEIVIIQMVRCSWVADIVHRVAPGTPVLFDAIDAMGLHFSRAADTVNRLIRPFARLEAARCRSREQQLASMAALTVAVAERDLVAIGVPNGLGLAIPVSGTTSDLRVAPAASPTILLSGNLGYRPTTEAAQWFGSQVWPALKSEFPGARWVLAGARPAKVVRALASLPGVEIHADVPDLGSFMAEAWVAIAPMASGSGVPMKVLEAWAAGVPVVCHPWTAAGLNSAGLGAVLQAEGANQWVTALIGLLKSQEKRDALAVAGRETWEQSYRPEIVADQVREAVSRAVGDVR